MPFEPGDFAYDHLGRILGKVVTIAPANVALVSSTGTEWLATDLYREGLEPLATPHLQAIYYETWTSPDERRKRLRALSWSELVLALCRGLRTGDARTRQIAPIPLRELGASHAEQLGSPKDARRFVAEVTKRIRKGEIPELRLRNGAIRLFAPELPPLARDLVPVSEGSALLRFVDRKRPKYDPDEEARLAWALRELDRIGDSKDRIEAARAGVLRRAFQKLFERDIEKDALVKCSKRVPRDQAPARHRRKKSAKHSKHPDELITVVTHRWLNQLVLVEDTLEVFFEKLAAPPEKPRGFRELREHLEGRATREKGTTSRLTHNALSDALDLQRTLQRVPLEGGPRSLDAERGEPGRSLSKLVSDEDGERRGETAPVEALPPLLEAWLEDAADDPKERARLGLDLVAEIRTLFLEGVEKIAAGKRNRYRAIVVDFMSFIRRAEAARFGPAKGTSFRRLYTHDGGSIERVDRSILALVPKELLAFARDRGETWAAIFQVLRRGLLPDEREIAELAPDEARAAVLREIFVAPIKDQRGSWNKGVIARAAKAAGIEPAAFLSELVFPFLEDVLERRRTTPLERGVAGGLATTLVAAFLEESPRARDAAPLAGLLEAGALRAAARWTRARRAA